MEQFTCGYCGSSQVVERFGGTVILKPIADAVAKVQIGTDRTAAELALVRLKTELGECERKLADPLSSLPAAQSNTGIAKRSLSTRQIVAYVIFILALLFLSLLIFGLTQPSVNGGIATLYMVITGVVLWASGAVAFSNRSENLSKRLEEHKKTLSAERARLLRELERNRSLVDHSGHRAS